jgi:hypothetical protein
VAKEQLSLFGDNTNRFVLVEPAPSVSTGSKTLVITISEEGTQYELDDILEQHSPGTTDVLYLLPSGMLESANKTVRKTPKLLEAIRAIVGKDSV